MEDILPVGSNATISGKIETYKKRKQIIHPQHIIKSQKLDDFQDIEPVYRLTQGLSNKVIRNYIKKVLDTVLNIALDDHKDPRLFFANLNRDTASMFASLVMSNITATDLSSENSEFYSTEVAKRTRDIKKGLTNLGWQCKVLTIKRAHLPLSREPDKKEIFAINSSG